MLTVKEAVWVSRDSYLLFCHIKTFLYLVIRIQQMELDGVVRYRLFAGIAGKYTIYLFLFYLFLLNVNLVTWELCSVLCLTGKMNCRLRQTEHLGDDMFSNRDAVLLIVTSK